jgi:metal-dependent amidase/aminoacylase/carboxypeptidase family protein
MKNNMTLAHLYAENVKTLGRHARLPLPGGGGGSTDVGNVSQLVPAIHPMIAIAQRSIGIHSPEFAQAAVSEAGFQAMVDGAKTVAMMIADLLANPNLLRKVKEEFNRAG